ncbi:MAG: hypothetical protein ACXW5U_19990 [Thermoanaerobaculia bacterium]
MATKKKASDPKLEEAQKLKISTIEDAKDTVREIGRARLEGKKLKVTGDAKSKAIKELYTNPAAQLFQLAAVLTDKVLDFALKQYKKLPRVGQRWIVDDYGHVQFTRDVTSIALADDVDMETLITNLRAAKARLKKVGIDVDAIIQQKEVVKLDDLYAIPEEMREDLGFEVKKRMTASLILDEDKLEKAFNPARRKAS